MRYNPVLFVSVAAHFVVALGDGLLKEAPWRAQTALSKRSFSPEEKQLPIRVNISIKQSNLEKLMGFIESVSDPKSENFGNYWSTDDILRTFAPTQSSVDLVFNWLTEQGFFPRRTSHFVYFSAPIKQVEDLFDADYHLVQTKETGHVHLATARMVIPSAISDYVDTVSPGTSLNTIFNITYALETLPQKNIANMRLDITKRQHRAARKHIEIQSESLQDDMKKFEAYLKNLSIAELRNLASSKDVCWFVSTPECIRSLYNVSQDIFTTSLTLTKLRDTHDLAVILLGNNEYAESDLDIFRSVFVPHDQDTFAQVYVGHSPLASSPKTSDTLSEGNLDTQMASFFAQGLSTAVVGVSGSSNALFEKSLAGLSPAYCEIHYSDDADVDCSKIRPATVVSTSFVAYESALSYEDAHRLCAEYGKLSLQGTSFLFGAGDVGVSGADQGCKNSDQSKDPFQAIFPSSCPYVTSVGGTDYSSVSVGFQGYEVPSNGPNFSTGGGFSNYFVSSVQKSALDTYFASHKPGYDAAFYNHTTYARGYPDIALHGNRIPAVINGSITLLSGTSASTPIFAGLVAQMNAARRRVGKPPLGFLNKLLYSLMGTDAFHDVTEGTNGGCNTKGFAAVPGWDPASGLGTPNFDVMYQRALDY